MRLRKRKIHCYLCHELTRNENACDGCRVKLMARPCRVCSAPVQSVLPAAKNCPSCVKHPAAYIQAKPRYCRHCEILLPTGYPGSERYCADCLSRKRLCVKCHKTVFLEPGEEWAGRCKVCGPPKTAGQYRERGGLKSAVPSMLTPEKLERFRQRVARQEPLFGDVPEEEESGERRGRRGWHQAYKRGE